MEKLPAPNNQERGVAEANSASYFQHNQKDMKVDYLSERVKKLVTAVYLVTNLISETDPLRHNIRDFSIKTLSLVGRSSAGRSVSEVQQEIQVLIKKIVEMLEVAFFSGYVSEMNFSVLKSEFDLFLEEMSDYENAQGTINAESLKSSSQVGNKPYKQHVGDINNSRMSGKNAGFGSDSVNNPSNNDQRQSPRKNVVEAKKNSRREAILSIMRRRGEVNIKDISSVVINCSEKTIQRELLELVESGMIKKMGERRWSTYSLA